MLQADYQLQRKEFYMDKLFPPRAEQFQKWFVPNNEKCVRSVIPISFMDQRFGNTVSDLQKRLNKPNFVTEKNDAGFHWKIFFFKEFFNGLQVISQFHLGNGTFFFGCHIFPNLEPSRFVPVKSMILQKYANINGDSHRRYDTIVDDFQNRIFLDDDVILRIGYLSGDEEVKNNLIRSFNNPLKGSNPVSELYQGLYNII